MPPIFATNFPIINYFAFYKRSYTKRDNNGDCTIVQIHTECIKYLKDVQQNISN